jgi:Flp pilus assembly pilin Flp
MPDCAVAALRWIWEDEDAASLVEYILLVCLIALVCVSAVTFLGREARGRFRSVARVLNRAR